MSVFEGVRLQAERIIEPEPIGFRQYHHEIGHCEKPCKTCTDNNLRIFEIRDFPKLPVHPKCHCTGERLDEKAAGSISKKSINGPDYFLKYFGRLPNYYITKATAEKLGWKPGKNLKHFAPGKMIGGDVYNNKKNILPIKNGRIWYECDVDYEIGKRNSKRLFYSNDGLMFYSYNHGTSFVWVR